MSVESDWIPYHAVQSLGTGPVLVLAPHPDDEVLGCGGAILRHVAAGDRVTVIFVTDGGGTGLTPSARADYVALRQAESRAAAAVLGYRDLEFWEYRDRELAHDEGLVQRLVAAVHRTGARWLYAPSPAEIHPDHRALARAVWEVAGRIGAGLELAYYEIGVPLSPNRLLDITALVERKRQAMACFASQLAAQDYDRHLLALNTYRTYTLPREILAAEAYWVLNGIECHKSLALPSPWAMERIASLLEHIEELEKRLRHPPLAPSVVHPANRVAQYLWRQGRSWYRTPLGRRLAKNLPARLKRVLQGLRPAQPAWRPATSDWARDHRPLVSLIIPVYNHADYLEACLRSALAQTWPYLEVIAVDDASPDPRVQPILQRLAAQDTRLRVFGNPANLGISRTQNRALAEAHGDIFGFLDGDDTLTIDAVATSLRYWHKDIVYSHSWRINVDTQDREVSRIDFECLPDRDYFSENLAGMFATHFKLIRREAFTVAGLFDPRFDAAQDYDLLMRIAFHYPSSAFVHVPEFLYRHRLHDGQTSAIHRQAQQQAAAIIQHEARLRQAQRDAARSGDGA